MTSTAVRMMQPRHIQPQTTTKPKPQMELAVQKSMEPTLIEKITPVLLEVPKSPIKVSTPTDEPQLIDAQTISTTEKTNDTMNSSTLSDYLNDVIACAQASVSPPSKSDLVVEDAVHVYPNPVGGAVKNAEFESQNDPMPLVHTVSVYRRMGKAMSDDRPQSVVFKPPVSPNSEQQQQQIGSAQKRSQKKKHGEQNGPILLTSSEFEHRAKGIEESIRIQLEQIHQASRALNLCKSTVEFQGSREEVDAQKALLLASKSFFDFFI